MILTLLRNNIIICFRYISVALMGALTMQLDNQTKEIDFYAFPITSCCLVPIYMNFMNK